jgi:hypothetical protein
VAEVLRHVGEQVVADGVGVPVGSGEQVLHSVGGRIAEVLGQLPAVLALGGDSPFFWRDAIGGSLLQSNARSMPPKRVQKNCRK